MINKKIAVSALLFGMVGGLIGSALLRPAVAWAYSSLVGDKIQIINNDGKMVADIFSPSAGGGILDLYSENGELRVQIGSYGSGGEKGQPLVGLSDNRAHLRFLIRAAGNNESPVVILKDRSGRDRLVMGLDLSGPNEEPFLATFDSSGRKKMIFGSY